MTLDPGLLGTIRDGGIVFVVFIGFWLLLTDRLITPGRFKDVVARLGTVEKVRDEALAGWKAQAEATKALASLIEKAALGDAEGLELLRGIARRVGVNKS